MPDHFKVFPFWVQPEGVPNARIRPRLEAAVEAERTLEFSIGESDYSASELRWIGQGGAFCASVFKIRDRALPVEVEQGGTVRNLDLDEESDLGEPVVFVYYPDLEVALMPFSVAGPRHPAISQVLRLLVQDAPFRLTPVIDYTVLERVIDSPLVRSIEYTLSDPGGEELQRLRNAGTFAELQTLGHHAGVNISIKISMGYREGGLANVAEKITQLLGGQSVTRLNAKVLDEDQRLKPFDLLEARLWRQVEVPMAGRFLDRDALRGSLLALFERLRPEIQRQRDHYRG